MYGAIIGDVAGSYIEVLEINELHKKSVRSYDDRISILDKNISLFNDKCSCTDDSVLTVAIADAILSEESYEDKLREYGNREISLGVDAYGRSRFGGGFINWLNHNSEGNSIGNGSAMRISSVGYLFNSEKEVLEEANKATIPSHNSKEAIDAARMVAISIYLARNNYSKADIKKYLEKNFDVSLDFSLEELRHKYRFSAKASESVPQAIYCFLISNDFEDAIRKALSIGGDADTIACIVGSIAEAYYGVPLELMEEVLPFIPDYFEDVIDKFYKKNRSLDYEKN